MTLPRPSSSSRAFSRGSWSEYRRIAEILRAETVGGALLVAAAALAVVLANSPAAGWYAAVRDTRIGPAALHLDLSVGAWAADGLLAIFFFLVGLELKREFVAGDLRDPKRALVPVLAAAGGVVLPALLYLAVNVSHPDLVRGWAIPTATDIAFALAVLAVIGSHLPGALRTFLLTLAVVDDLIAIVIIAVAYTDHVDFVALGLALLPIAVFTVIVRRWRTLIAGHRWAAWALLLPCGIVAWALVHASGVHATIAGVVLGLIVPVRRRDGAPLPGLSQQLEHRLRPLSAGVAVPVFAFFSAGVTLGGAAGVASAFADPVTLGILLGLVVGKPIGIVVTTWLTTKLTSAELDDSVQWIDLLGIGMLGGIGFTVSLLVSELSFEAGLPAHDHAKVGVLAASVLSALLASALLVTRNRRYAAVEALESADADADGVPDVYDDDPHGAARS